MSAQTIYNTLCLAGMSPIGACAMLGNMMAESSLQSNIAQRGQTSLSDEAYTLAADNGTISFATDGVGYGLCQWTHWERKPRLLAFAKQRGKSVGDEQTQVYFCIRELQDYYNSLWQYLRTTDDIDEATDRICAEFERPAVKNFMTRRDHAKRFAAELIKGFDPVLPSTSPSAPTAPATGDKPSAVELVSDPEQLKLLFERQIQVGLVGLGYDADNDYNSAVVYYAEDIAAGRWG